MVWDNDPFNQSELSEALEKQENTFQEFKRLWYESYLLSLREQSRNLYQSDWTNRIKVGDVVLVKMIDRPRPFWLLGLVLEIVMGCDNIIRSVKLKRGDGQICHHSICHLYPIELSLTHSVSIDNLNLDNLPQDDVTNESDKTDQLNNDAPDNLDNTDVSQPARPQRRAALACKQMIKSKLPDLV